MALLQKIPVLPGLTDQLVSVDLGVNPYVLRVLWNERFQYFSLSVMTADKESILTNAKMVKNSPITAQFRDLKLPVGNLYLVQESGDPIANVNYDSLGLNFGLYYFEADEGEDISQFFQQTTPSVSGTIWDSGTTQWDVELGGTIWDSV